MQIHICGPGKMSTSKQCSLHNGPPYTIPRARACGRGNLQTGTPKFHFYFSQVRGFGSHRLAPWQIRAPITFLSLLSKPGNVEIRSISYFLLWVVFLTFFYLISHDILFLVKKYESRIAFSVIPQKLAWRWKNTVRSLDLWLTISILVLSIYVELNSFFPYNPQFFWWDIKPVWFRDIIWKT